MILYDMPELRYRLNKMENNFLVFWNVESIAKTRNIEHAILERIKPIVLGFVPIGWESGMNPKTIRLIVPKVAFSKFRCVFPRFPLCVSHTFSRTFSRTCFANFSARGFTFSSKIRPGRRRARKFVYSKTYYHVLNPI